MDWQVVQRPLVLFSMLGEIPGLQFEKFGKKDPRIGLHLLGHAGASPEFCGHAFERFARAGLSLWHAHVGVCLGGIWERGAGPPSDGHSIQLREPGRLPTQLVWWSLQLHQAHEQIQSMLYLSAMQCLVSQSPSSPAA